MNAEGKGLPFRPVILVEAGVEVFVEDGKIAARPEENAEIVGQLGIARCDLPAICAEFVPVVLHCAAPLQRNAPHEFRHAAKLAAMKLKKRSQRKATVHIGIVIRNRRIAAGLNQTDFEPVNRGTMRRIEKGDTPNPRPSTLKVIADKLPDCSVADLFSDLEAQNGNNRSSDHEGRA
jgi:hypothetical protein